MDSCGKRPIAWRRWFAAAGAALALIACGGDAPQEVASAPAAIGPLKPSEPFGLTTVTLRSAEGDVALSVPVYDAYEPPARRRGLMYRRHLPPGTGMVFRFPKPRRGGFYMKNTRIPLSIAYYDQDGRVLSVLDMAPCDADPCPTYDPEVAYSGALEVNRGFFDRIGLDRGWRIEVPFGLPPAG